MSDSAYPFVHLGARSEMSLGESIARVEELCWEASRDEQGFLALTDVNSVGRVPEFAATAARSGLRPVIGAELSVLPHGETHFRGTTFRVRVLVDSERGWRTLLTLINRARKSETPTRPPHISFLTLLEDPRGLLFFLGGERGEVTHLLKNEDFEKIEQIISDMAGSMDRGRIFFELPPLEADDGELARTMVNAAKFFDVMVAAIPVVHCGHPSDDAVFRFFSGQSKLPKTLGGLIRPLEERNHLAARSIVAERYAEFPEAMTVTLGIAQHCAQFTLPQMERRFPRGNFGRGVDAESYIWNTAFARATERYGDLPTRYKERLNREFREIVDAGLASAVVSMGHLVEELETEGVQRGPGAGILTNSVIASLLGLTRLDPLRFDLSFDLPAGLGKGSFPLLELSIPANQQDAAHKALDRLFEGQTVPVGEWRGWKTNQCLERAAELLARDGKWASSTLRSKAFVAAREHAETQPATYIPSADCALDSVESLAWLATRMNGRARNLVRVTSVYTFAADPIESMAPTRYISCGNADRSTAPVCEWTSEELGQLRHGRIQFVHSPLLDLIGESTELARAQGDPSFSPERVSHDDAQTYRLIREGKLCGIAPLEHPVIRKRLRQGQPPDLHAFIKILKTDGPDIKKDDLPDFATILLCHVCAAIKAHKPNSFYAAALSQAAGNVRRTAGILAEVREAGIRIEELLVNFSDWRWTVEGNAIRPGFIAVRGMNETAGREIVYKRREMHYTDIADLCHRCDRNILKAQHLSALGRAGAFDRIVGTRGAVQQQLEELFPVIRSAKNQPEGTATDGLSFFDRDASWWLREHGAESVGDPDSDDPMRLYTEEIEACGLALHEVVAPGEVQYARVCDIRSPRKLTQKQTGKLVTIAGNLGIVESDVSTSSGVLADFGGVIVSASGDVAKRLQDDKLAGKRLYLTGTLEKEPFQWILNLVDVYTVPESLERAAVTTGLNLDLANVPEEKWKTLLAILKTYPGETPVSMAWLPAKAPRTLRAIAGRTVLRCAQVERQLEEILEPTVWAFSEEPVETEGSSTDAVRQLGRRVSSFAIRKLSSLMKS